MLLKKPQLHLGLACFILLSAKNLRAEEPNFYEHILPIFAESCVGCHDHKTSKGGLDLSTYEALKIGGDEGPSVVVGKPEESFLFQLITHQEKPYMPPRRNDPLTQQSVELIKRWIQAGCPPGKKKSVNNYSLPQYKRPAPVASLRYSPNGKHLYVGGHREVLVHDIHKLKVKNSYPLHRIRFEGEQVRDLKLSPNKKLLAIAGGSPGRFGEVRFVHVDTFKLIDQWKLGQDTLFSLSFSHDGKRIAVSGASPNIYVVDIESGKRVYVKEVHADWVMGIGYSLDDRTLVTLSRDQTVKVLDAANGNLIKRLALSNGAYYSLALSPTSPQFVAGGQTQSPTLFDWKAKKKIQDLEFFKPSIYASAFSPQGTLFAVSGMDSQVHIYSVKNTLKLLRNIQLESGPIFSLAFNPANDQLAATGKSGEIVIIDLSSHKVSHKLQPFPLGRVQSF